MGRRTNTAVWHEKYNRWQVNVQKDGQRRSFTSSTAGRNGQREANAKADKWLDDGLVNPNIKVNRLCELYMKDIKERTSQSNWKGEQSKIDVWINPNIGKIKVFALTEQHLQNVVNKAYQKGSSKKTLKNLRSTMTSICKYARKCNISKFFPENIVIPKQAKTIERTILQPDDIKILFSIDTTIVNNITVRDEMINAYRLQVVTGLRPGEVLGLKKADKKGNKIAVRRSINIYGEETTGKNDNAKRDIILHKFSEDIINDQLNTHTDNVFLFPRIVEGTYCKRLKKYCEINGIPVVTPYELRHTFVSVVQDMTEGELKPIIGHSKSMDSLGIYAHKINKRDERTAEKVGAIFSGIIQAEK